MDDFSRILESPWRLSRDIRDDHYLGTITTQLPGKGTPEEVAVVGDERVAKLIVSTPRLFAALKAVLGLLQEAMVFGQTDLEKRVIWDANTVVQDVQDTLRGGAA